MRRTFEDDAKTALADLPADAEAAIAHRVGAQTRVVVSARRVRGRVDDMRRLGLRGHPLRRAKSQSSALLFVVVAGSLFGPRASETPRREMSPTLGGLMDK